MTSCPAHWEREIVDGKETGRARPTQFMPTPRNMAVPPSRRVACPFLRPDEWDDWHDSTLMRKLGA